MTREEFNALPKEEQDQVIDSLLQIQDSIVPTPVIKCKCKPTYNFQSIEFEWDLTDDNFPNMLELYYRLVEGLKDVAPEQPDNKKPKGPVATDKQKSLLKKLGVKFDNDITAKEATKLIDQYFEEK